MLSVKSLPVQAKWLLLSLLAVVLDQCTKYVALNYLTYAQSVPVVPMLNWTLQYNFGAAFSFLADAGGWQRWFLTGLSAVATVVFAVWLLRLPQQLRLLPLALALVIGGAVGNLIDRVLYGYVVDFVDVYYNANHFPVFNIADSAITLGAVLLIVDMLFYEPKRAKVG